MTGREILWQPTAERAAASRMAAFQTWLKEKRNLQFTDYNDLWRWSVEDLDGFWSAICQFFDLKFSVEAECVLGNKTMPGAEWFPGAKLNWAENILRVGERRTESQALIVHSETFGRSELTWGELTTQVASVANNLRKMGVEQGDRVVAILPNTEASIIACLATASIGAIWSLCAPDMGHVAILDRFKQIEPKVLITQDGYVHAGKTIDRRAIINRIAAELHSVNHHISIPFIDRVNLENTTAWCDLLTDRSDPVFTPLPFDHPLWIVYSSGTTGNPKPIVHGHGGVLLEGSKQSLHQDLSSESRFCWLTSSGWVMWNVQLAALGQGATTLLYDRAPNYPELSSLWRIISEEQVSYFGAGAAYIATCAKAGITPGKELDLAHLVSLGTTGSPLSLDAYKWVYEQVKKDIWLAPISGGTDLCGAFVCGNVMLPVRAGEMQCRALGNAVRSFDDGGNEVFGEVGELVCTEPLPSMPLYFWGDTDGSRLHSSYFDTFPGIWRHGDWIEITQEGGSVIYGRSDATINRRGLRLGSSEIYQAVEGLPEVLDSLVVDLEFLGKESFMPLFVVLASELVLDDPLRDKINTAIRVGVSARFIPDEIVQITEVPRTLSGKKLEVPVKKLLLGGDHALVVNRDSMENPKSFDAFVAYAQAREIA